MLQQTSKVEHYVIQRCTPLFIPHCQTARLHSVPTHGDIRLVQKKESRCFNVMGVQFLLMIFTDVNAIHVILLRKLCGLANVAAPLVRG